MFINKSEDGANNLCGRNIAMVRKQQGRSQRQLADAMQLAGLDVDKNAIQRIETGQTPSAGSCLLSALRYGDNTYIIGVFGCPEKEDRFDDTLQLFNEAIGAQ